MANDEVRNLLLQIGNRNNAYTTWSVTPVRRSKIKVHVRIHDQRMNLEFRHVRWKGTDWLWEIFTEADVNNPMARIEFASELVDLILKVGAIMGRRNVAAHVKRGLDHIR